MTLFLAAIKITSLAGRVLINLAGNDMTKRSLGGIERQIAAATPTGMPLAASHRSFGEVAGVQDQVGRREPPVRPSGRENFPSPKAPLASPVKRSHALGCIGTDVQGTSALAAAIRR